MRQLGYEHIGISRNSPLKQVKREVKKSIVELEEKGYLKPLLEHNRFKKERVGEWTITFEQSEEFRHCEMNGSEWPVETQFSAEEAENILLVRELTKRGVSESKAMDIAERPRLTSEFIQEKIEVFDWLVSQNAAKVSKNPAGYLVRSIETPYETPEEFRTKKESGPTTRKTERAKLRNQKPAGDQTQAEARNARINSFWDSLSAEEIELHKKKAFSSANDFEKSYLEKVGELADSVRKKLLDRYALGNSD